MLGSGVTRAIDFFMLDRVLAARARLGSGGLESLRGRAERASWTCDAAERLWAMGDEAGATALMLDALDSSAAALESLPEDPWRSAMRGRLDQARAELDARDIASFQAAIEAVTDVVRELATRFAEPGGPTVERWYRIGALLAVLAVGLAIVARCKPDSMSASASTQHYDDWPERAIDGSTTTSWTTDGPGWIDVSFRRSRELHAVDVYAPQTSERTLRDARLVAYDGSKVVAESSATFGSGGWTRVPLAAPRCTRVRLEVISFDKRGAAVAEILPQ